MVHYRRNRIPGGTYFFTVALRNRQATTLVQYVDSLRMAFRTTREKHPFEIEAAVILPEHLHTIWTLPSGDDDYAGRWRTLKSHFTHSLMRAGANLAPNAKGEYGLWQRRYWEHTIRDQGDLLRHLDYIHFNPVKHGWATRVRDWPHSSFHRFVRKGLYAPDWGDTEPPPAAMSSYGE